MGKEKEEQYTELDIDIIKYFNELEKNFAFPINLKYIFQNNMKQKQLIKVSKLSPPYAQLLNGDILITVNEAFFDAFDDEIKEILFTQEIDKINIDLEKDTIKIGQLNLKTSFGIIKRFSYEKVEKALEVEKLFEEQQKDKKEEII